MHPDPPHGIVLVLAEDREAGEVLGRRVAAVGERPLVLHGDERLRIPDLRHEDVDLVVAHLSADDPVLRPLLLRLLSGEVLGGVPRIHLYRGEGDRMALADGGPEAAALALPYPPGDDELQARVRLAAEVGRLRRELTAAETRDPVTGLSTRAYFLRRLDEEFARARRHRSSLSLVLFDIDRLARINEAFGYSTGDSVVQQFAEMVRRQVRREDVGGRLEGATLAVVLPGNGCRGAAIFAHKVRTDAEEIVLKDGSDVHRVRISAGITTFPESAPVTTPEGLLRAAEDALCEAKARGGNRVFIDETVLRHERRVVLVVDPDPDLLDLAEDLLEVDDYQVVRADTARAALQTLRFRRPDLLIVDVQMAEPSGGTPLVEQVLALFPAGGFPIIGLCREGGLPAEQLVRLGVDRFITKPFSVSLLRAAARELLEGTRAV